ncbi:MULTISPECIES: efflux RND transporter periplasmic adaptor subunit [Leeuwenhoekiella]|jgi:HlyD family secretion protein|uniref:Putative transport/efflux component protein n=1 Tax=Leeuwenhoekiella blandensis (strain CECT 7118 / CCUG 51940 / KCTC 22103 / MED217) TaxID=398720 RepID=A3XHX5_LEEBM|nr:MULTISPECIES: efflux RND transporter periplasmic adaptor subunit [Leeuwenhoekiella]EAQ51118.1 putative transport/efflux component protein [Leeuwenhoekiella blandensis MED217]MAO42451.1 efflux RND transporter periplasmic adaptor subunit [Leeuwenhoekiella sp.]HBT08648.1 efflux RND transporter periplasmic adaptor subunit [Leeuwenhoekiella sp.]HCW63922.1 efflux RND transporter periplasmic adaptor subunit [Leeuwenhoekiella sp.]|tara:strand:- start:1676 stop:2827 length:1152 start_codon:yes stop_codon:yes gene_type:complete
MKKSVTIVILAVIAIVFIGSLYYLYQKNQEDPVVYTTETPSKQTIVKKTVATGSIVPREEVLIKPNISGIIKEILVEAGAFVEAGDLLAQIEVVPNASSLVSARNNIQTARTNLETAKLTLENQESIYQRQKALFDKGVVSANDFDNSQREYNQAVQNFKQQQVSLSSAQQNYDIVKTGTTTGLGNNATTSVRATITGMVLEVPVKEGNQVIESNNFNDGTTIASLANVNDMIFEGKVDESEVGKIKEDLPLEITVGAIENKKFDATLDYIAPKGVAENGAIQFEIKGTLAKKDSTFIRAGLSANASIILERADDVLAIKEALVQYDSKTQEPFVEVETGDQEFERRAVKLGVSDGIYVEILDGISENEKIKVWNAVKPAQTF